MRTITAAILILALLCGCSRGNTSVNENTFKNKTFVHLFFETEEECMEAQPEPDFFHNCHQQMDFLEDNKVELMLSDIIWIGKYEVEDGKIYLYFDAATEIPDGQITFVILNTNTLVKVDDHSVWKKMKGNSIWN